MSLFITGVKNFRIKVIILYIDFVPLNFTLPPINLSQ